MRKGYLYIFISTITFSLIEVALKMVSNQMNPIQLTFIRFFIGGLVLFPLAVNELRKRSIALGKSDISFFALSGFIGIVISMILYQLALVYSPASTVAVLVPSIPVFSVLLAVIFLHEKVHLYTVFSMLINILGLAVIIKPQQMTGASIGVILTLLSYIVFSVYTVMGRNHARYYGGAVLTCFGFLFGSLEILCLIFITHIQPIAVFFSNQNMNFLSNVPILYGITAQTLPDLIFTGVCLTGFGYMFYFLAIEATSTATGSLAFFIKPALAPVFAMLILNEAITSNVIVGILITIIGSSISLIGDQKAYKVNKKLHTMQENID